MTPVYVFDLDGTLTNCSHRVHHILKQPKDWEAFFAGCGEDPPIQEVCDLLEAIYNGGADVVFLTGRPERYREDTQEWLDRHFIMHRVPLYMRADGDHRDDVVVKTELLARLKADGYEPVMAFEDRDRCVEMFRKAGVRCAQVAPGDF